MIDYSSRAHIQVSYLAVAHLSVGQSDRKPACAERGGGGFLYKRVGIYPQDDRSALLPQVRGKNYYSVRRKHERRQLQGRKRALVYRFVRFTEVLPALAVTDNSVFHAVFFKHICGNFAGERAVCRPVYVFCADFGKTLRT